MHVDVTQLRPLPPPPPPATPRHLNALYLPRFLSHTSLINLTHSYLENLRPEPGPLPAVISLDGVYVVEGGTMEGGGQ